MSSISNISKIQRIVIGILIVFSTVFGFAVRPGVELANEIVVAMFTPKPYVAPMDEYTQKVNDLWHSDKHQATCKANAAAAVSLELADKYLKETRKQQLMAVYAIPESVVNETNRIEAVRKMK